MIIKIIILYVSNPTFIMFNEAAYSYIVDNIYVGNIDGLESDVVHFVEQIISLVPNHHKERLETMNIRVHEIIFDDHQCEDIVTYSKQVYDILDNGKMTFIHCLAGKSRSVACVIYYLMKKHTMTMEEAHDFIHKKRPTIDLNFGFYVQLHSLGNVI